MENIVFLILRRMRRPLLTLVAVYALSILGLTLIPGRDADGNVWHMSIFHAFYFVSYMATTIGFGEIPYAFTDLQRLWVSLSLYASVISWIYAFGTILALVQDKTFQEAIAEHRFARHIRRLREPFHVVCGYGETGSSLVQTLTRRGQHVVVIDIDESRTSVIQLQDLRQFVPALHGDAAVTRHLEEAGLQHPSCVGVVALTDDNLVNLKIAITAKLLNPKLKVICRSDSHDVEKNMASFGTDYIVDPFDTFASHLTLAFQAPCLYLLQRWLTGREGSTLSEPLYPPTDGHWIVCGYGRFGKAICRRLQSEGIRVVVVEAKPEQTGQPAEGLVVGRGTEADTLIEAGIENAAGLVAGTNDDANNLSVVMTARGLNDDIFVVVRQNQHDNRDIIAAVDADMVMHPSAIIADKIRVLMATPMLYEFMSLALYQEDSWACELVSRVSALVRDEVPHVREWLLDRSEAAALCDYLEQGGRFVVSDLVRDPWQRERSLRVIVLLVHRRNDRLLLPGDDTPIRAGDRLLMCGNRTAFTRMQWTVSHRHTLDFIKTGEDRAQGWVWRHIAALVDKKN
ncbi:MAG: potassium channel protein [Chromatiaceae bacterium]|nr:potassium channel protein [Gammaproteobacteria bacterium]MCP5306730.1 potassium channel protein [Chromatiaceae bacterium]MCP5421768.1 potassium channel protein [Chromatiaceae bacterium]